MNRQKTRSLNTKQDSRNLKPQRSVSSREGSRNSRIYFKLQAGQGIGILYLSPEFMTPSSSVESFTKSSFAKRSGV